MQRQSLYHFGGFELDTTRRRLSAPDGSPCPLSSRGYDILVHLVENRDRLVGKEELMKAVWPNTVVEENNLNQAVSAVRRALGDSRDKPRFVLTIAGRGYQFIGALEPEGVEPALPPAHRVPDIPPAGVPGGETGIATDSVWPDGAKPGGAGNMPTSGINRRRVLASLGAGAAAIASGIYWWHSRVQVAGLPRSLAVLPFRPLTGTQGDPAIELGVADLLVNRLSTLQGLAVAPLSSVMRYTDGSQDRSVAGKALGVEVVLDGNVQIRDDQIRLTARLIETATGRTLWADDFTERLDDFFAVQDSLATQLVEALTPHLPADARQRAIRHETTDVEAWQLYANGRYHVGRRNEASLRKAIEFFSAAVARDPDFSLALAGLSETWSLAAVFNMEPPAAAFEYAREAAARAIRSDPGLPDGYMAMGQVVTQMDRDLGAGRELYRRALALDPTQALAHAFMALNLAQAGRHAAAIEAIAKAQQLEPASFVFSSVAGLVEYMARELDEAERRLASVLRAVPNAPLPRHFLARVMLAQGRSVEVLDLMAGHNEPAPGSLSTLGRAYAQAGRRNEAAGEVARLEQLAARGFGVGFDLAQIHVDLGNRDAAIAALERAIDDRSQLGGYVNVEPALDVLRDDPRFGPIAARMARF
jgi:DNA-binding winged helix-turn-helix (wHTH) protein/TolB-like protein/Tfp pilus assembly protein PilF